MQASFTSQSLSTLLFFPFKDPAWIKKAAVGFVFALLALPTLGIAAIPMLGYAYEVMQGIIREDGQPALPEWKDWGKLFVNGLKYFGAMTIWSLPAILIIFAVWLLSMLFVFLDVARTSGEPTGIGMLLMMPLLYGGMGVSIAISLALGFLSQAGIGHMVAKDSFPAFFHVRAWWSVLRANLGGYIVSFVLIMGLAMITSMLYQVLMYTIVLCFVAPILLGLLSFYLMLVSSAVIAQAYSQGANQLTAGDEGLQPV